MSDTCLYAVDFGLATWWRNPKTKKPYAECKKPIKYKTGTARYASLNVHRGRTHARRDDMESLGYLLLDLLLGGELPWSGVTARTTKAGWDRLKSLKEDILLPDLCRGLPHGIMDYIDYTRRLRFGDRPDYDYLRRILRGCIETGPFSKLVAPHPYTRMIPSPPRSFNNNAYYVKRRNSTTSLNRPRSSEEQHQEDVFIMDDLAKELPTTTTNTTRKSSSYNNNRSHYRYPSSSSSRQHYSSKRFNNKPFGWNHHSQWEYPKSSLQTP